MLLKHRDKGSIPDGLMRVAQDTKKGTGLFRKLNAETGEFELVIPSSANEAKDFYGFVTLGIENKEHKESFYDTISKGTLAICYTRVPNNSWKTTEFEGELAIGDKCAIGFEEKEAGKVRKAKADETATMEVIGTTPSFGGYEEPLVIVRLL